MPVIKCPNQKYRIGSGPCVFDSKDDANRAYRAYLARKYGTKGSAMEGLDIPDHIGLMEDTVDEAVSKEPGSMVTQTVIFSKDHYPTRSQAISRAKNMGFNTAAVDETENSFRFRQKDPDLFIDSTFRTKPIAQGISIVMGKLKK